MSRRLETPTLPITYTLFDPEVNPVGRVQGYYSLNGGGQWFPALATGDTVTAGLVTGHFTRTTSPVAIPDAGAVSSTLTLSGTGQIHNLELALTISHTHNSQLAASLHTPWPAPTGTTVLLFDGVGGGGVGFEGLILSDRVTRSINTLVGVTTTVSGVYRPVEPLSRFQTAPLDTPFTLVITDSGTGETGTLEWWTLKSVGATHVYTWDTFASGFFGRSDNVVFRLDVHGDGGPGPFQRGKIAVYSPPFRVRGTQVRVLSGTAPISNAIVYRLPAGQPAGGTLLADSTGQAFRTDSHGYLQGRGEIGLGDHLLALVPVHTELNYEGVLEFDGVDDRVIRNPLHNGPITATTVSFWMRSEDTSGSGTVLSYATSGPYGDDDEFLITDYNDFTIHRGENITVSTGISATDGAWHHIGVTWRGSDGQVRLYKDGVAAFTGTLTTTQMITGGSLVLGQDQDSVGGGFDPAQAFQGSLDEVRIWNVARTEAQIQADMFQPALPYLPPSEQGGNVGLVAYWPFDDPNTAVNRRCWDQSGNGNDGVLLGATWVGDFLGGYTVYHTNGAPTEIGLQTFTVAEPGVQVLTVTAEHPLVLFDFDVSLEWDAQDDPVYLQQLEFDLHKASQHLYDFTDGQAALGHVTVHQNGDHWIPSHVVVYATNRVRPFAAQGGSVVTPTVDPQHNDPDRDYIVYDVGQVRMGATWNRYGDPGQTASGDWPLALAHELSHYFLFLDDVYLGLDDDGLLIPVDTCTGSAMGDMYDPDNTEFVYDEGHWNDNCADTLAGRTLGRTEWETIRLWYPWLATPVVTNTGPGLMPFDLTTVDIRDPITPTNALADPTFFLDYAESEVGSSEARAFLLRSGDDNPDDFEYVYDLGSPVGGQNRVLARGAQPGDRLCIFDRPRGQYGCEVIEVGDERLGLKKNKSWTPLVQLSPVTSQTLNVEVGGLPATLTLRLGSGQAL